MSDYTGVVTNVGQAKIAAAIGGTALNLTTIRVGDGNGAPITPSPAMTDLVRRVGAAYPIISAGRDPVNANHWRVSALIPVDDGPFDIREIAVFDAAGDMIAIARHVLVEKRSPAQGAAVELVTDIVFPVSETAQVTVQIQPAAAISIFQMLRAGFCVVESATVTAPPGAPALGRTHVIPAGATGAWAGLAGYLAQWNGTAWVAVDVPVGHQVVDQSKTTAARYLSRTATGWAADIPSVVQSGKWNYAVAAGTANALTVTLDPPLSAYTPGLVLRVRAASTNTAAYTLDAGAGAKAVVRYDGTPTQPGDRPPGVISEYIYDPVADAWRLMVLPTRLGGQSIYGTAGSYSFVVPDGVTQVEVEVWGAGGGSGACLGLTNICGSTGGGGGYARKTIKGLTPGSSVAVTIGTGGTGGVASPFAQPGAGGSSSFGAYVSATGGGSGQSASGVLPTFAGSGGTGSGGDVHVSGAPGGLYWIGNGGSVVYAPPGNAYGNPFRQPGSGDGIGLAASNAGDAGTAGITSTGASRNGGAGAPGKVIVRY
ncbi:phage tail protein [Camelimonas lactis]|uniref:Phage-related tail fiber protein n=1 Tax=Camelimonas lactis TaxID=659006 RepID=A0A4R2GW55_9HYPH|nr:phage tail protein [Camelimonas lactis]TCO15238.1 phage-related tail fiber protein [Camelimonas lactis]